METQKKYSEMTDPEKSFALARYIQLAGQPEAQRNFVQEVQFPELVLRALAAGPQAQPIQDSVLGHKTRSVNAVPKRW